MLRNSGPTQTGVHGDFFYDFSFAVSVIVCLFVLLRKKEHEFVWVGVRSKRS